MIVLLCGGNKSTQARDIERAKFLAEQWKDCVMTTEIFSRYDQACGIKIEEDIAAYICAVMDDGGDDPAYVARALGAVARARTMSQRTCGGRVDGPGSAA